MVWFERKLVSGLVLAFLVWGAMPTAAAKPEPRRNDVAVTATNAGDVVGRVYDAVTGLPIEGALVAVQQEGAFPADGKAVSRTNHVGRYSCSAPLGRISTSYNVAGLLLGGLFGPSSTTTRRIDVTQVNLRVRAQGYQSFEGVVRCRYADAANFSVTMEPILLTPQDSAEVSTVADGWGALRVLDLAVSPSILRPREKATVTVRLQGPAAAAVRERESFSQSMFAGGRKDKLHMSMTSSAFSKARSLQLTSQGPDGIVFSGELSAPDSAKSPTQWVSVLIETSPVEIAAGGRRKRSIFQVIPAGAPTDSARMRLGVSELLDAGETAEAQEQLEELCGRPDATLDDKLWLAQTSLRVHDHQAAVDAFRRALAAIPADGAGAKTTLVAYQQDMTPDGARWAVRSDYAQALLLNGQPEVVLREVRPEIEKVKEKDRPKQVPVGAVVAVGSAYLETGDLAQARTYRDSLREWPAAATSPAAREFRARLRTAELEAAIAETPESAQAWADSGRALIDQGQWEEAVVRLQRALELDRGMAAVRRDLGYALLHLRGSTPEVEESLEEALAAAERQTVAAGGQRSTNFYDWHTYAMLLYRRGEQQRLAGAPGSIATLARAREALIDAIKCGRAGADVAHMTSYHATGSYIMAQTSRSIAITGFAYPEAAADSLILASLDSLADRPDDYLAWFALASSLTELDQGDLAESALEECLRLRPDFPELAYAQALLLVQQGDRQGAMERLEAALARNPRHPFANRTLAELRAEEGDMIGAAGCLAAHAQYYGSVE